MNCAWKCFHHGFGFDVTKLVDGERQKTYQRIAHPSFEMKCLCALCWWLEFFQMKNQSCDTPLNRKIQKNSLHHDMKMQVTSGKVSLMNKKQANRPIMASDGERGTWSCYCGVGCWVKGRVTQNESTNVSAVCSGLQLRWHTLLHIRRQVRVHAVFSLQSQISPCTELLVLKWSWAFSLTMRVVSLQDRSAGFMKMHCDQAACWVPEQVWQPLCRMYTGRER